MAWCRQAPSHYMSQCWPRSLSPHDVTRPQWVNLINEFSFVLFSMILTAGVFYDHGNVCCNGCYKWFGINILKNIFKIFKNLLDEIHYLVIVDLIHLRCSVWLAVWLSNYWRCFYSHTRLPLFSPSYSLLNKSLFNGQPLTQINLLTLSLFANFRAEYHWKCQMLLSG